MILGLLFIIAVVVNENDCSGAGPPGSSHHFHTHGGSPGSIPAGAQLIFPPNPDFGQIIQIKDPQEAIDKHIYSDPKGPLGYINENGQYVPFGRRLEDIRSKTSQQVVQDNVDEAASQKVEIMPDNTVSNRRDQQRAVNGRDRASTLFNVFNRRHQPGPIVQQTAQEQFGPEGPPRS